MGDPEMAGKVDVQTCQPTDVKVTIRKCANGFIVTVGCSTFVAKTWVEASEGIGFYWVNPKEAQKRYSG